MSLKMQYSLLCPTIVFVNCRGSAIAKVVGNNVKTLDEFEQEIKMWVFEEDINGRKLSEIINTDHENVKYLPGQKIPENVVCGNYCDILGMCVQIVLLKV